MPLIPKTPGQKRRAEQAKDEAAFRKKRYWKFRNLSRDELMDRILQAEDDRERMRVSCAAYAKHNGELLQENVELRNRLGI